MKVNPVPICSMNPFESALEYGTISSEDFGIVEEIIMKTKKQEILKLFKDNGQLDKYKLAKCADGRFDLRIPVSMRNEYGLKPHYKAASEEGIIKAVYSDLHRLSLQKLTLDDVYEMWKPDRVAKIQKRGKSMHTAEKNFEAYNALIKGTKFGSKYFVQIRQSDFDDFFCELEGRQITASRANEIKTTLNLIWEYAKKIELVDINYAKNFYLTEYSFVPKKVKPIKTTSDRDRLIEYFMSLDTVYGYACALMECLNMRVSEIKALKWSDIFMEDGVITVNYMVNVAKEYVPYTKSHDEEGAHVVPLSERAIDILETIRNKQYGFKDDFVFLGKNDNFILTGECNENYARACKELGIRKHLTTHDCRRYAATNAAIAGMSGPALQRSFGWKDRNTAESYIQLAAVTREQESILKHVLN